MGKYLDIAKKFEAGQQAETVLPPTPSVIYRARYHQTAHLVLEDCGQIDSGWLLDRHPALWSEMQNLDDVLARLESVF